MVTTVSTNGVAVTTPSVLMMSAHEIAQRDGVARPGVSRTIRRLINNHGLEWIADARGRIGRVNVAQYDHLRERFGNAIRAQAPRPAADAPPAIATDGSESLEAAQRKRAWIEAERSAMRLDEERGELLRLAGVMAAVTNAGIEIARVVDRLPQAADDLAAAVGRDGVHGLRVALKQMAQKAREEIAGALSAIADTAPEMEELPDIDGANVCD